MSRKFLETIALVLCLGMSLSPAIAEDETLKAWIESPEEFVKEAEHQFVLGKHYYEGDSLLFTRNPEKAAEHFKRAADRHHPEAMYYLATMYHNGEGVEQDEKRAEEIYQKAAEAGQVDSQMIVGVTHLFAAFRQPAGSKAANKELVTAAEWIKKAADKNHPEAQFWYGEFLVKGSGVQQDTALGLSYIRKSAEQNNPNGQAMLGTYLWKGELVRKDLVEAAKWLTLSKKGGNENVPGILHKMEKELTPPIKMEASKRADQWYAAFAKSYPEQVKEKPKPLRLKNSKKRPFALSPREKKPESEPVEPAEPIHSK